MNVAKKFIWMEVRDGILREPPEIGPHYDRERFGYYDTEEEALSAFVEKRKAYPFVVPLEMVLLTVYEVRK